MRHGSLFAGIGGLDLGLERAGYFGTAWQVEIDKFCNRVLEARFPNVQRYGDIRDLRPDEMAPIDILSGGFPCQDLSVAGKRAGLDGDRSGLFFEFARVAAALLPRWLLVENVPGLLSSNQGEDLRAVVDTLAKLGYGVAWRVLDSRFFGVPQRRRRIFLVGHLGAECPYEVLFEPEGGGGHPPPSREIREDLVGTLGGGAPGAHRRRGDLDTSGAYIPIEAYSLTSRHSQDRPESGAATLIAHTLRAEGFDASEDGTGRGTPLAAISENQRAEVRETDYARQLTTGGGKPGQGYPAVRDGATVRRLTPTECERLQGFPDGWTCVCGCEPYSTDACRCPDGRRYAALGNAVTVNVAHWLGCRISDTEVVRQARAA